jgi:hypothetical protein
MRVNGSLSLNAATMTAHKLSKQLTSVRLYTQYHIIDVQNPIAKVWTPTSGVYAPMDCQKTLGTKKTTSLGLEPRTASAGN